MVSTAGASVGREKLRAARGHVGGGVHHGGDVDARPHNAGGHRAAPADSDLAAVRVDNSAGLARC